MRFSWSLIQKPLFILHQSHKCHLQITSITQIVICCKDGEHSAHYKPRLVHNMHSREHWSQSWFLKKLNAVRALLDILMLQVFRCTSKTGDSWKKSMFELALLMWVHFHTGILFKRLSWWSGHTWATQRIHFTWKHSSVLMKQMSGWLTCFDTGNIPVMIWVVHAVGRIPQDKHH